MSKKTFFGALLLASVLVAVYFRFYSLTMPFFDRIANQEVADEERKAMEKSVDERFGDASKGVKAKLVAEFLADVRKTEKDRIGAKVRRRAHELKERFRDDQGHVYLSTVDSYYWYRLLRNLLASGHIGDRSINGVEYDDLIGNPIDPTTKRNVHLWLGWVFYKVASFFFRDAVLSEVLFYVPIFLAAITAIFSFLVARSLGACDIGAFLASCALSLAPIVLGRTVSEWYDTDIYNVLFPLLIFGTCFFAVGAKSPRRRFGFSLLSGVFCAMYASTWKGWWFIFDILILSGILYLLNEKLSLEQGPLKRGVLKEKAFTLLSFFAFGSFFVILVNGWTVWRDFVMEPLRLVKIFDVTHEAVWPNVFLTVAELGRLSSPVIIGLVGGYFIFFLALLGLIYNFLFKHGMRDERWGFGLLALVFWILWTYYASFEAMRFVLLLMPPLGLAFGLAVSKVYELADRRLWEHLNPRGVPIARTAITLFFSIFLFFYIMRSDTRAIEISTPAMDDYMDRTLVKIDKETPKNAFIDSWWDFGHWFKAIGRRRVLLDGMTQNTPYAYWMASALLSDNEDEALGILRMINTSDNKAADILEKEMGWPASRAVATIKKACSASSRSEASAYLSGILPKKQVQELLACIFVPQLPPAYFIVSYDMVPKITAITYVGNWDFEKVDLWLQRKKVPKGALAAYIMKTYGLTQEQAQARTIEMSLLNDTESKGWFSKIEAFYSDVSDAQTDGALLFFDNGLVVNLDNHHARVASPLEPLRGTPKSLFYVENGALKEEKFSGDTLDFSALIFKQDDKYKGVLLDTALANSMLVRLFYLRGEGLKHFKLWHKEVDEKGRAIYVYEIQWPQLSDPSLVDSRQPNR